MTVIHCFEEAGLGKAPFRFVGYYEAKYQACPGAPVQPGTSCDYCGTSIIGVYEIKSYDGKLHKVGCDCIRKTGDVGLINLVNRKARRIKNEARHKREQKRIDAAVELLKESRIQDALKSQPHPYKWRQDLGETLLDWANWTLNHAGNSGCLRVCSILENMSR